MKYNAQHYIDFYTPIPPETWCIGELADNDGHQCSIGLIMYKSMEKDKVDKHTGSVPTHRDEYEGLAQLLDHTLGVHPCEVNNGEVDRYQQATPKERIIAALEDAKKVEEAEELSNLQVNQDGVIQNQIKEAEEQIV